MSSGVSAVLSDFFKDRYIEKLVQSGILKETTGYARNRVFLADEILQAVEGLEH